MVCARCSVAEISPLTNTCELCGYAPGSNVAVDEGKGDPALEKLRRELGYQFQIEVPLGTGPDSSIYLAREQDADRHVILKIFPAPQIRAQEAAARFREAVTSAQALEHPHLVPILRFGTTDNVFWYTMETVRGRPLREVLKNKGPLELKACLRICAQIASALDYMHRRGLTHGHLKPENVLIDPDGWAHVCDAIVPRALSEWAASRAGEPAPQGRRPSWIAPEDGMTGQRGPSSDQYALGALVYECLTGSPPATPPVPLNEARADLPAHVVFAVRRAMAEAPTGRFPSVLDFLTVLESGALPMADARPTGRSSQTILTDPQWKAPPRAPMNRFMRAAVAVIALVALVWGAINVVQRIRGPKFDDLDGPAPATALPSSPDSQPATGASAQPGSPAASLNPAAMQIPAAARPGSTQVAPAPSPAPSRSPATTQATRPIAPPTITARPPAQNPPAASPAPAAEGPPGKLFVNASPWGQVFVDGQSVGNTPKANIPVSAGTHRLRVTRDGYDPFERTFTVAAGETVRITDIVLVEHRP